MLNLKSSSPPDRPARGRNLPMSELRKAQLQLDPFRRKCDRRSGARPTDAHASRRRLS
jgi:hypothetical protein